MDEPSQRSALLSALTTEHFVLQAANSSTYAEASARSSLYVMALSSALVTIGFLSGSAELLMPFAATVLPAIFLLGIFTVYAYQRWRFADFDAGPIDAERGL